MVKVKRKPFLTIYPNFAHTRRTKFVFALHAWSRPERGELLRGDLLTENG